MEVAVLDKSGKDTGRKVQLSDDVFGIEPNNHAIYLDVKQFLAHQRQGTHKSKERAEIAGSTKKLKKQKGTGTARAGSIKSPVFRGGGRVFGPRPRNYGQKLNKGVKKLARKSALSLKVKESGIKVVESFDMDVPKTKEFNNFLAALGFDSGRSLFITGGLNDNIMLSARNLEKAKVLTSEALNTHEIMLAKNLIISEDAIIKIEQNLSK